MTPKHEPDLSALPFDAADEEQINAYRNENLGRSLAQACDAFEALVTEHLAARDLIRGLAGVHIRTARSLALEGNRMSELAERTGLSKQHIGSVVRDLQAAGIVDVEPDPTDGRARIVRFTPGGRAGLLVGLEAISCIVARTEKHIGRSRLSEFRRTLRELVELWSSTP